MMISAYSLLGVSPSASRREIERAYRRAMRGSHPDLAVDEPDRQRRTRRAAELNRIIGMLRDDEARARYDAELDLRRRPASPRAERAATSPPPAAAARPHSAAPPPVDVPPRTSAEPGMLERWLSAWLEHHPRAAAAYASSPGRRIRAGGSRLFGWLRFDRVGQWLGALGVAWLAFAASAALGAATPLVSALTWFGLWVIALAALNRRLDGPAADLVRLALALGAFAGGLLSAALAEIGEERRTDGRSRA